MRRLFISLVAAAGLIPPLAGCYTMGYYTGKAVHTIIPPGPPPEPVYAPPQAESAAPPVQQYVPPAPDEAPAPDEEAPAAPDDSGGY